ncbi:MAG: NAD-dependent protein deacylase [Butyricicoccaceae bacterium]
MNSSIEQLQRMIDESERIVFFGGAGVSTESGIPDFRSVDGLYHMKYKFPPETILSATFFKSQTEEFYRFYRDKMLCLDAKPNAAHKKLAELEQAGKLTAVITQNIDGLHQAAGSKAVYELHGSVHRNYCTYCRMTDRNNAICYDAQFMKETQGVPRCPKCGSVIKPDVVLYEESLDGDTLEESVRHLQEADMLIIGGTSLAVYPAAGLVNYFRGKYLVVINKGAQQNSPNADLTIDGAIGQVLGQIKVR